MQACRADAYSTLRYPRPRRTLRYPRGSLSRSRGFSNPANGIGISCAVLCGTGRLPTPLVIDAVLAALALEHGAMLCTTDRDFAVPRAEMDKSSDREKSKKNAKW
jgi:hypothetical protein